MELYRKEKNILLLNLNQEIIELLKENNVYVAGGTITSIFSNDKINDYDIFFRCQKDFNTVKNKFHNFKYFKFIYNTNKAVTYKYKDVFLQLVKKVGKPQKIIGEFDFTICMGYYDFANSKFYFDDNFFLHLAQRKIIFNSHASSPLSSLFRIGKYMEKGFSISHIELVKIGLAIYNLKINTYGEVIEQLAGISKKYMDEFQNEIKSKIIFEDEYDYEIFQDLIQDFMDKNFDLDKGKINKNVLEKNEKEKKEIIKMGEKKNNKFKLIKIRNFIEK